jgi:hypothetical protein
MQGQNKPATSTNSTTYRRWTVETYEKLEIIEQFITSRQPKDKSLQKALGLPERELDLLWAGLSSLTPETGLNMVGFSRRAKDLGFFSSYLTSLGRKEYMKKGDHRGDWAVTDRAVEKFQALLNGGDPSELDAGASESSVATEGKPKRKYRKRKKASEPKESLGSPRKKAVSVDPKRRKRKLRKQRKIRKTRATRKVAAKKTRAIKPKVGRKRRRRTTITRAGVSQTAEQVVAERATEATHLEETLRKIHTRSEEIRKLQQTLTDEQERIRTFAEQIMQTLGVR